MSEPKQKTGAKPNKIVIVLVTVVVLGVILYAVAQNRNKAKQPGAENAVPLTAEALDGNWIGEMKDGIRYDLLFEAEDTLIVAGYKEGAKTPSIISIRGSFAITEATISTTYTIDLEVYEEQYTARLTADQLVLSPVKGSEGRLAGTYQREKDEVAAADPSGSGAESSEPTESSTPDESEPSASEPEESEPESSEPESSEPESSEPESSVPESSEPQEFTIPEDIRSYFSKTLIDLYGYVPEPDDGYNGGCSYRPPECPYEIIYTPNLDLGFVPNQYDTPVAILGNISLLLPGKSSYSDLEIKEILGDIPIDFYWSETDGNYYGDAYVDGYEIYFCAPWNAEFTYFDIRSMSSAPEPSEPQEFIISEEIRSYFSKSLIDLYGYVPDEPDGYLYDGEIYDPPGCPFRLVFVPGAYAKPVMLVGDISLLLPGKSSYDILEIQGILRDIPVDFYWSEEDGAYYGEAYVDVYTVIFIAFSNARFDYVLIAEGIW